MLTLLGNCPSGKKHRCWVRCVCGNEVSVTRNSLINGRKDCGCQRSFIGTTSHRLTVIADTGKVKSYGDKIWKCVCQCGNNTEVSTRVIKQCRAKSCGCLKKEKDMEKIVKHGQNNPAWKGGVTDFRSGIRQSIRYRAWRGDVFLRDKYTCRMCLQHGGKLEVHHKVKLSTLLRDKGIKSVADALNCQELWEDNNGVTLCRRCHKKVHRKGTKIVWKNWGMEHWLELNDRYCYKRILINAGQRTSLQYHHHKLETNYIISGEADVWLEDGFGHMMLDRYKANDYFTVLPGRKHRVVAVTDVILQEASTPEVDDVVRVEDDAGRPDGRIESEHSGKGYF